MYELINRISFRLSWRLFSLPSVTHYSLHNRADSVCAAALCEVTAGETGDGWQGLNGGLLGEAAGT